MSGRLVAMLALAALATQGVFAQDRLKVAVGGRGIGEAFVTEVGDTAGYFKKYNLALDIFYTDGGGETQQAVISNSAQIGMASGFLGAIGVFAKGAPVRIIGGSYTGGRQVFWYVAAASPVRRVQDLEGKAIGYSTTGSSTHAGLLALQKHYKVNFKPVQTGNAAATMTAVMSGAGGAGGGRGARPALGLGGPQPRNPPPHHDVRRRSRLRQADQPRRHRQCRRAQGAARRVRALHARLPRLARLDLRHARGHQGL